MYLIDTEVLLWAMDGNTRLWPTHRRVLETGKGCYVSAASVWEISAKQAAGRLQLPTNYLELMQEGGLNILKITAEHASAAGSLPTHHEDIFDRMVIAQARTESFKVLTSNRQFKSYDVELV